jgi:hypothetical protein
MRTSSLQEEALDDEDNRRCRIGLFALAVGGSFVAVKLRDIARSCRIFAPWKCWKH